MSKNNSVVAVYRTHIEADEAVKELQSGGVDMHKLSIVGKGYHTEEQAVGYYTTGDRMKYWGKIGAFWGGFLGLAVWICLFPDSGYRPNPGGRTGCCMDRGGFGRRGRSGRAWCSGCRTLQHRNSQGQHREIRSSAQNGPVPPDRQWDSRRGGQGERYHRKYTSRPILAALRPTSRRCGLAFLEAVGKGCIDEEGVFAL